MAKTTATHEYFGKNPSEIFQIAKSSILNLNHRIIKEDASTLSINAKSKITKLNFPQNIRLYVKNHGDMCALTIQISNFQITDWGEGEKIINEIFQKINTSVTNVQEPEYCPQGSNKKIDADNRYIPKNYPKSAAAAPFFIISAIFTFIGFIIFSSIRAAGYGTVKAIGGIPVNGDLLGFSGIAAIFFAVGFAIIGIKKG